MNNTKAPKEERFIRLPKDEEVSEDCGLTGSELKELILPCEENGGDPLLRHQVIDIKGKDPVILIPWEPLHQWIKRRDPKGSYETPRTFYKYLVRYPSCHKRSVPSSVVMITDLYQSYEVDLFDKALKEQSRMGREIWVVYTRKGAAIAYKEGGEA